MKVTNKMNLFISKENTLEKCVFQEYVSTNFN